jgi:hypothetical protein
LRRALIALLSAGCTVSGTGVMLHVEAPGLMPTSLEVVASYDGANVSRTVPLGGAMLPASFLAELPDHDLTVTFDVTATPSGHGTTMAIAVPAHHIVDASVTLTGGGGDGGADGSASDGSPDMGFFTSVHGNMTGNITSIWGTSSGELYATCRGCVGENLFFSTNGTDWTPSIAGGALVDLNGVWGTSNGSDVWLVGANGTILHGSAGTFTAQSSPATSAMTINAIWGVGTEMFAVGSGNLILHFTGGGWVSENLTGTNNLLGVWGTSSTDVYVVGSGGTIFHKTIAAASWPAETSHTSADLYSVGGSSGDVYAVGSGVIARSSGSGSWTASTQASNFARVQAAKSTDVWIAGAGGLIERGLGTSFNTIPTGTPNALDALWVLLSGEAFVGGDQQTILHHL